MISLPVLDTSPQRPNFAQGPRSLSSVRLLRVSVTDRCNLRCVYCMPDEGVSWMAPQKDLLTADDIEAVVAAAVRLGIRHVKLTGGEPTIRPDIIEIAQRLARLGIGDLSLTTNGLMLDRLAQPLRLAGVDRLTVSCDSLRADRYKSITHGGDLDQFWRGVRAAHDAGFTRLKVNVVVMRGINDDEVADFAMLATQYPWSIRFIEYMPLGDSVLTGVDPTHATIGNEEIKARIAERVGPLESVERHREVGVGPAMVYNFAGAIGRVGFISAMSQPFCESCNRLRVTAVGELRSCLFDGGEVSLMPALRPKPDLDRMIQLFADCVVLRPEVHSTRGNRAMSQIGG
ncbi:MAG: GTP 3',8-cyclase MoaA [Phycisphaerales bacterium]|nr:GTP 3',8-cyclase MoaA [Phycisphaerales bacterium]